MFMHPLWYLILSYFYKVMRYCSSLLHSWYGLGQRRLWKKLLCYKALYKSQKSQWISPDVHFFWLSWQFSAIYCVGFSFCWFNLEVGWYSLEQNIRLKFLTSFHLLLWDFIRSEGDLEYMYSPSDLMKSTAVDESLSKTSTRCSVPENPSQLQEYIVVFLFDHFGHYLQEPYRDKIWNSPMTTTAIPEMIDHTLYAGARP